MNNYKNGWRNLNEQPHIWPQLNRNIEGTRNKKQAKQEDKKDLVEPTVGQLNKGMEWKDYLGHHLEGGGRYLNHQMAIT